MCCLAIFGFGSDLKSRSCATSNPREKIPLLKNERKDENKECHFLNDFT
jgi:hypothetical protein